MRLYGLCSAVMVLLIVSQASWVDGAEDWPRMGKDEVAKKLAVRIAEALT